jgi:hypothetical protein
MTQNQTIESNQHTNPIKKFFFFQTHESNESVTSRKTPSYIRTGREGEWATWEIKREERGRVCGDGRAGSRQEPD